MRPGGPSLRGLLAVIAIPASVFAVGATAVLAGLALFGAYRAVSHGARPLPLSLAFPAAWVVLVVADMLNGAALESAGYTGLAYLPIALVPLCAIAIRELAPTRSDVILASMAFLAIIAANSAWQSLTGVTRPGGFGYGSLTLGLITLWWGVFAVSAVLAIRHGYALVWIPLALALYVLLVVESKIALIMAAVAFSIVLAGQLRAVAWRWKLLGLAGISALVVAYLNSRPGEYLVERMGRAFAALSDLASLQIPTDRSVGLRLEMVDAGLRAFTERPLFGHGGGRQLEVAVAAARPDAPYFGDLATLHNDYLMHLVGYGLPGLAALLALLLALFLASMHIAENWIRRAGLAVLVATVLFMGVDIVLDYGPSSGPFAYLAAFLFAQAGAATTRSSRHRRSGSDR